VRDRGLVNLFQACALLYHTRICAGRHVTHSCDVIWGSGAFRLAYPPSVASERFRQLKMTISSFIPRTPARVLLACLILAACDDRHCSAWELKQAPLMTDWAQLVDANAPLPEYPRPQMVRSDWLNLNGIWEFQAGSVGEAVPVNQALSGDILVPFPMESAISGVMEHHPRSWYRRTFTVPARLR
jgi:hypothetical protein